MCKICSYLSDMLFFLPPINKNGKIFGMGEKPLPGWKLGCQSNSFFAPKDPKGNAFLGNQGFREFSPCFGRCNMMQLGKGMAMNIFTTGKWPVIKTTALRLLLQDSLKKRLDNQKNGQWSKVGMGTSITIGNETPCQAEQEPKLHLA